MKIKFDYKEVSTEDIKTVIDLFYEKCKDSLGKDNEKIEMGKINVYISLNNKTDNEILYLQDEEKNSLYWLVKNRIMKKTNKKTIAKFIDTEDPEHSIVIYEDKEKTNKNW